MSDWQPGRWNHPENIKHFLSGDYVAELKAIAGKPVRIRFDERIWLEVQAKYGDRGIYSCFEVVLHPDDAMLYFPVEAAPFTSIGICTCCVLTD